VELLYASACLYSNVEDELLRTIGFVAATIALVASGGFAFAEDAVDPTAVKSEDGKYLDKEGNATFKVAPDGTVDWYNLFRVPPLPFGVPRRLVARYGASEDVL
jgi:hypothetical protein